LTNRASPAPTTDRNTDQLAPRPEPISITFVTSSGCHFCSDARALLDELDSRFTLDISEIDLASAKGMGIVRRWRVPFPPVVLIEGRYHAHGRISARKLTKALTELAEKAQG